MNLFLLSNCLIFDHNQYNGSRLIIFTVQLAICFAFVLLTSQAYRISRNEK